MRWSCRVVLILIAACRSTPPAAPAPQAPKADLTANPNTADFDQMWEAIRDKYAFFGTKLVDWDAVREHYRPLAANAADARAFIAVLEGALDELYDPHTHLGVNLASSWRLVSYDIWAEWQHGEARISDVRIGSAAASAGIRPGMVVLAIDGRPVTERIAERRPHFLRYPNPEADAWALLSALSGRHDRNRVLTVRTGDAETTIEIADLSYQAPSEDPVSGKLLPGGILYVRIATFGDPGAVAAFDALLAAHKDAKAIVFDVRDNPGGDTAVAVPIMGRLVAQRLQYAWMNRRDGTGLGDRWQELVDPRGPSTFNGPVAVVVNRWSTSMAEGFAMGLDGMKRAVVVGTPMARLGAGVMHLTLTHSQIDVQLSAEPIYHVSGASRDEFVPPVLVAPRPGEDAALAAAVEIVGATR